MKEPRTAAGRALDERWRLFRDEAVRHAGNPSRIATVFDGHRARIEAALAALPDDGREQVVVAMESEGVVTWGDAGHRERFLAADDAERIATAHNDGRESR